MWLVRTNPYHLKNTAFDISDYLIVPNGDKVRDREKRGEIQEKEAERI